MTGLFLVVEGMDGAGKSTQIRRLAAYVAQVTGQEPVLTLEPGGTAIGQRIRAILLDPASSALSPQAEALLYAADRGQHVAEVVRPALEAGRVVISDRYVDSSLAYQGLARGLGVQEILDLSLWATGDLLPDLVVLLDLPPETGRGRAGDRAGDADRMDQQGDAFHRRVANAYWALSRTYPQRFAVVDASATPGEVEVQVRARVEPLLGAVGAVDA